MAEPVDGSSGRALELELSIRGVGFTWTSADVRHTKKTWSPMIGYRAHIILFHVLPVLGSSWAIMRYICMTYLHSDTRNLSSFEQMPFHVQIMLTAALGIFLISVFLFVKSPSGIIMAPLSPYQLSYFPPLYTMRV